MQPQPQNFHETVTECVIAYGSNLSNELGESRNLTKIALERLAQNGLCILRQSGHFRTPAWPPGAGPDFVNGVILAKTHLDAPAVLELLHAVESDLGRTRRQRWEARVIDLDLIDFGGQVLPDRDTWTRWADLPPDRQKTQAPDQLILPHPRVHERAFVLVPLAAAAPGWRHPVSGQTVERLVAALDSADLAAIVPLDG